MDFQTYISLIGFGRAVVACFDKIPKSFLSVLTEEQWDEIFGCLETDRYEQLFTFVDNQTENKQKIVRAFLQEDFSVDILMQRHWKNKRLVAEILIRKAQAPHQLLAMFRNPHWQEIILGEDWTKPSDTSKREAVGNIWEMFSARIIELTPKCFDVWLIILDEEISLRKKSEKTGGQRFREYYHYALDLGRLALLQMLELADSEKKSATVWKCIRLWETRECRLNDEQKKLAFENLKAYVKLY